MAFVEYELAPSSGSETEIDGFSSSSSGAEVSTCSFLMYYILINWNINISSYNLLINCKRTFVDYVINRIDEWCDYRTSVFYVIRRQELIFIDW